MMVRPLATRPAACGSLSEVRCRRVVPVRARSVEGRLFERTAAVQLGRPGRQFMSDLVTGPSASAGFRHFEAGVAFYMVHQSADVVVFRPTEYRVLMDEARRLADPHRHAQFLTL